MKKAIICVDDEDIILEALKDQLGNFFADFDIETASTALEAMEIYDELIEAGVEVPVVISDYLMPGTRGDEFLIKVHQTNPDTLTILLTGHANLEGITNAINRANLYRFIPKPWDREDLILTVREAVRSFLQELEIRKKNRELIAINENLEKLVDERTKELANANATKDKFFSIIAHDLKNSFNNLLGFSDLLIADFDDLPDDEKLSMVSTIKIVSERTYKLLQNLLDWARMQTGNINFTATDFDLFHTIFDEFSLKKPMADQKNIALVMDCEEGLMVNADTNMVSTVVRNLISNAIKFTRPGGRVVVYAKRDGDNVLVSVKDNGVGISKTNIEKLFKVSEKVKTYGTNNEEGTGLGLILCKDFVIANHGKIWVDSIQDEGSIFNFTLQSSKTA